jgi:hypothetical protein
MLNATDTFILAAAGYLTAGELAAIAENIDHLAQLVDDPKEAEVAYGVAAALRGFAGTE